MSNERDPLITPPPSSSTPPLDQDVSPPLDQDVSLPLDQDVSLLLNQGVSPRLDQGVSTGSVSLIHASGPITLTFTFTVKVKLHLNPSQAMPPGPCHTCQGQRPQKAGRQHRRRCSVHCTTLASPPLPRSPLLPMDTGIHVRPGRGRKGPLSNATLATPSLLCAWHHACIASSAATAASSYTRLQGCRQGGASEYCHARHAVTAVCGAASPSPPLARLLLPPVPGYRDAGREGPLSIATPVTPSLLYVRQQAHCLLWRARCFLLQPVTGMQAMQAGEGPLSIATLVMPSQLHVGQQPAYHFLNARLRAEFCLYFLGQQAHRLLCSNCCFLLYANTGYTCMWAGRGRMARLQRRHCTVCNTKLASPPLARAPAIAVAAPILIVQAFVLMRFAARSQQQLSRQVTGPCSHTFQFTLPHCPPRCLQTCTRPAHPASHTRWA